MLHPDSPVSPRPASASPTADPAPTPASLTRAHVLREILELNPTADLAYLAAFGDSDLSDYLEHLVHGQLPRPEAKPWTKRGNSRAISSRESDI